MELKVLKIVLYFAFLFSLYLSFSNISYWGLSYDETLFVNGTIHKDNLTFISKQYHGIVLMVFQYIGALKSWLYIPIFSIWGVNIYSIRIPMILVLYLNLFLIYKITIKYFDLAVVYSVLIILLTDLSFIYLHKIDNGPNALESCLKLLAIYFITRPIFKGQYFIIFSLLLLGIFNKMNFIWFVNALYLTLFFYYIVNRYINKKNTKYTDIQYISEYKIHILTYLALILFFIYLGVKQNIHSSIPISPKELITQIFFQINNFINAITNFTYENYYGWTTDHNSSILLVKYFLFATIAINVGLVIAKKITWNSLHIYLFLFSILLLIQILITKEAFHLWHFLILYPFIQLIILNTYCQIPCFKKMYLFVFLLWFGNNLYANFNFYKKTSSECNAGLFEPNINKLISYVKASKEKTIISLGWGIHNQLLITDRESKKYIEFVNTNYEANFKLVIDQNMNLKKDFKNILLILNRKAAFDKGPAKIDAMANYLKNNELVLSKINTINDNCGAPLFEIYKMKLLY